MMSYGGYGKADPYSEYMSGGKYAPPKAPGAGMSMDQMLGAGQLGLNALGTVASGFGAYQAYQAEQEARREEQRRYEDQRRIAAEERKKQDEQRRIGNIMGYGGYAQSMDDRRRREYGGYASRVGL
jgi:hypothetical protein